MKNFETKNMKRSSERSSRRITACAVAAVAFFVLCIGIYFFSGAGAERVFPVYINEILAANTSFPNDEGRCCDYIELYNSADYAVDLSGFQLGDISGSGRYVFPSGTTIPAHGYLVIYCDRTVNAPGYAPFGISRSGGEEFYLIGAKGAVVDSVITIPSDMDQPMVRTETGELILSTVITPDRDNNVTESGVQDVYNAEISPVRISEISAEATGYLRSHGIFCDWVEICNTGAETVDLSGYTLSDNMGNSKFAFPEGTQIAAGAYMVIQCTTEIVDPAVAPFGLTKLGGETVVLKNAQGLVIEVVNTLAMETGSQTLAADGTWTVCSLPTPGFPNTEEGYNAFIFDMGAQPGTVRIVEVMSDSAALYPDAEGDFSDWVELYNAGDRTVDLSGWYLSDNPKEPEKWRFPAVTIAPGQRLVIYCSGKDIVLNDQIHTGFSLSASGESIVLSSYLGHPVEQVDFGRGEVNQSFVFDSGAAVLSAPTPGYPNDASGVEAFNLSQIPTGPLAIWEVMTSNDSYLAQALGECYDWVEIRNISSEPVNLSEYSITDDPGHPGMHALGDQVLEPGACAVVILSGDTSLTNNNYIHAPFTLNAIEDQLLLYRNGQTLIDCVYLKGIPRNMSYGRSEGIGGFFYMEPSPQNPNFAGYRQISSMPQSEIAPGVYTSDSGVQVTLDADGVIYYTTDGSEPTAESNLYTGPIPVNETQVLRAISMEAGKLPSSIYTVTLVIGEDHDIPIISLVTNPDGLWGADGVYKSGDKSVKEIDLSGNVAYSGPDGSFSRDCEMAMHGDTSLFAFDKKSFKVRFKDSYGGPLNYDVFEDGEVTQFSSLVIRAAHESTYSSHLHDAFIASIAAESCDTVIPMKYKYVAMYLNGEYWGLYAIREHHSEAHYASYMNVPIDSVTMIRYTTDIPSDLKRLYKHCMNYSLSGDANYAWAQEIIDISSMTDWIILQSYMCNIDINNNMRYYYSTVDGLWRCGLVDLDLGMTGSNAMFDDVLEAWHHGEIPAALFANNDYKDYAAKRLAELLAGPLSDENTTARVKDMADSIRSEVEKDCARWNIPVKGWEKFYKEMLQFCNGRAQKMINDFCGEAGFSTQQKQQYFGHLLK